MKMDKKVRNLVFTSVLAALVIVLQVVITVTVSSFPITFALIPIVIGAVVLGPLPGTVLGLVFGIVVSILSLTGKDPGGQMVFAANPFLAWALCLLKGAAAGFVPAMLYKLFRKHEYALSITYVFTGIFLFLGGIGVTRLIRGKSTAAGIILVVVFSLLAGGLMFAMNKLLTSDNAACYIASVAAPICNTGVFIIGMLLFFRPLLNAWAGGSNTFVYVLTGLCGVNFLLELTTSILATPVVVAVSHYSSKRNI
ncbi:MAG: energy-coupled thiamine transporter ThiT [Clostridia bacterium]|nr:energy-coupled thiamine transporter ThiT [Clostridia bacterium]